MKLNRDQNFHYALGRQLYASREAREEALAAIETLIERARSGDLSRSGMGICANLKDLGLRRAVDLTCYMAVHWKHPLRSTSCVHPIGGDHAPPWEGDGLIQRLDFLQYMRKRLRDQLRRQA